MMKEPANIKLFGTKILLQESGRGIADREYSGESCVDSSNGSGGAAAAVDSDTCPDFSRGKKRRGYVQENQVDHHHQDHQEEDRPSHRLNTQPNSDVNPRSENEQSNSSTTTNALNKPDKITTPCPRCNSSNTKFCYYNNYNISQPRHFCKGCQRYWTDGGTTRNVPVGSGRRKTKNYYISKAQMDNPTHGMGPPMCESMASGVNLFYPFPYPNIYPLPSYYTPWLSSLVQHPKASQKPEISSTASSRNGDFFKEKAQ